MTKATCETQIEIGGTQFPITRPHPFGLVIQRSAGCHDEDYLHDILLAPANRDSFFALIESERLVICKDVHSVAASYRKVRGKSSYGKLSQAEYYHHDGCSCPTKPRFVEIRFPHQKIQRNVATAIAPFLHVIKAMIMSLPERLTNTQEIADIRAAFSDSNPIPAAELWDGFQGRITRLVRREMDAESSRAFFRDVDRTAGAYDLPWEMGESRLMLNAHDDLSITMQHRRAYQQPRGNNEQNGSLVKRWTAEDL